MAAEKSKIDVSRMLIFARWVLVFMGISSIERHQWFSPQCIAKLAKAPRRAMHSDH